MDYEEISLKELIIILLKGWKWIVSFTLITTLAAIVFTLGFKPVLYQSNSQFNIRIPDNITTQYGTYRFPSTNVTDYTVYLTSDEVLNKVISDLDLNLSVSELRNSISFSYDKANGVNLVNTSVTFYNTVLSAQVHQDWLESFKDILEETYQQLAIDSLIAQRESQIELLATEQTQIRFQLASLKTYKDTLTYDIGQSYEVSRNNYSYMKVLDKESELNLRDYEISSLTILYNEDLDELKAISVLNQLDDKLNVLNGAITLPKNIDTPSTALDRGLALNSAIGFVLGAMLGLFVVFFLNYWKSEN